MPSEMVERWQPIETAPDGKVLLWCSDTTLNPLTRATEPYGVVFGEVRTWEDGFKTVTGKGMTGDWTFSHWMPLPEPPCA